ncbi:MAG: SOS response-associated peptidase [Pseudomonadota bacterium]
MPGRFFLTHDMTDVAPVLDVEADNVLAQRPRHNISPGQEIVTFTADGFSLMRWGIIPVGRVNARGRPVMETLINARSETLFEKSAYQGVGRAVVPATGWYEWTGERRRKKPWRLSAKDGAPLFFAAVTDVWAGPGDLRVPQVAILTCAPSQDVAPIHHRMGVLLEPSNVRVWLAAETEQAQSMFKPWPNGRLSIKEAKNVDWNGP